MPRQLIYTSSAVRHLNESELAQLLSQARKHNERLGVTGMLVYADGSVLQVIEGEFLAVEEVMERVSLDTRHTNIITLADRRVETREFAEWSMAFRPSTDSEMANVAGFSDFFSSRHAVPDRASAAHRVLLAFRRNNDRAFQ